MPTRRCGSGSSTGSPTTPARRLSRSRPSWPRWTRRRRPGSSGSRGPRRGRSTRSRSSGPRTARRGGARWRSRVDDLTRAAWRRHLGADADVEALRAELAAGTMGEAFAATAADRPDAAALDIDGVALTHGEIDARAARVGGFLRARGVERGDRVLLCAPTSMDLAVAYLGTVRIGATAMPTDAALTAAELRHLLEDGAPVAAFVADDARERLAEAGEVPTRVSIGEAGALDAQPPEPQAAPRP